MRAGAWAAGVVGLAIALAVPAAGQTKAAAIPGPLVPVLTAPAAPFAAPAPSERPRVGPAPVWALSADIPPPPPGLGGAVVQLLNDQQVRLTVDTNETYVHFAYRIDSPQALQTASFNMTWDPALEVLTIHRYRLIRDGQIIDQLGDGQKLTVVRREPNLEQAALDGRLTATWQPEDVRVGDIVEFSLTKVRRDPALAGRAETQLELGQGQPVGRARLRVLWSRGLAMHRHLFPGLPEGRLTQTADGSEYLLDLHNFTPPRTPDDAPLRFRAANAIEFTNAAAWSDVSATMTPLFEQAAAIKPGSSLAVEAAHIRAASPDPKTRATLALKLVQSQVRYLLLAMDGGGYRPQPAETTWARRFGDCKAKTVLLLALLKSLDVDSEAVLVATEGGDVLADMLPRAQVFNHVMVRARIGGKTYWLDGTRPDDPDIDRLRPPQYHYALPLVAKATLEPIPVLPLERPLRVTRLDFDVRAGLTVPAKASAELRLEGDAAVELRVLLRQLSAADRDRAMRELWRREYSTVDPATVSAADDPATGALVMTMAGTARMDWGQSTPYEYEADGAVVGFKLQTARDVELAKTAPFSVAYPFWTEYHQTILLPPGKFRLTNGDLDRTLGPYVLKRQVKLEGDQFTLLSSTRTTAEEMPYAVSKAEEANFATLSRDTVYLRAPNDYALTGGDRAALRAAVPTTAQDYLERAAKLLGSGDRDGALSDSDAALRIDPKNARAMGAKARLLLRSDKLAANKLVAEALAIDPQEWNALGVRAQLAAEAGRYADAEKDFTAALVALPDWPLALSGRALARLYLKHYNEALADAEAFTTAGGNKVAAAYLRAQILTGAERYQEAIAAYVEVLAAKPDEPEALYGRAHARLATGDKEGARADLTTLAAVQPKSPAALIERSQLWDPADRAHWQADLDEAARRASPDETVVVWKARAEMAGRSADYPAALKAINEAARADPNDVQVDQIRIEILRKSGKLTPSAEIEMLKRLVVKKPNDAVLLNSLCWTQATVGVELGDALAHCEAALKLQPGSAQIIDSRGFVHLRLKQYDLAIADYDAALAAVPGQGASLYGRGLARLAKGDASSAAADFAAARKAAPNIDVTFGGYGMAAPDAKK